MEYAQGILREAAVRHEAFHKFYDTIWVTGANQVISTYEALTTFAKESDSYRGWHAHHIVEHQDLKRLGATARFPVYEKQLCVLLPKSAHEKRLNSVLAYHRQFIARKPSDLLPAYYDAYELMGDYSGGGEKAIKDELMRIVRSILARVSPY